MRHRTFAVTISVLAIFQAGCADPGGVTQPLQRTTALAARGDVVGGGVRRIEMMDACDPASFDAVIGVGTCVRAGGVTFDEFIAQLTKHGEAGAWHFAPPNVEARVGETLLAINRGGETHTFTEVARFGGGIVPSLNQLSGNTVMAPECGRLEGEDFVPPGGTYADKVEDEGTELYQCCIHPWMRTVVHARGS
jgi:plastocyanin